MLKAGGFPRLSRFFYLSRAKDSMCASLSCFVFSRGASIMHAVSLPLSQVDLRETISLMQSYGGVKQHPFSQHRSNSARIAPCATGKTAVIGGGGGGVIANDVVPGK